ncbi:MAG: ferritin-like domain-containing protein [Acidimicrobiia bacterium]
MDINSDELRRQLREVDAEQKAVDKRWREALKRMFDPGSGVSDADKAAVLGVPARRQFLRIGGVTVVGAALLAACGDDETDSGGAADETTTTTAAANMDLALAKTAASLEALAVATYTTAAASGKVTDKTVGAVATMFMDHHKQHQDALNGVITGAGGQAVTEPNAAVKAAMVDPVVSKADLAQADIVKLAYDLEGAAAQTYSFASTALSTPELRSTIMTIGGIEARHAAIIGFLALKLTPAMLFPAAFSKAENPLPAEAIIM